MELETGNEKEMVVNQVHEVLKYGRRTYLNAWGIVMGTRDHPIIDGWWKRLAPGISENIIKEWWESTIPILSEEDIFRWGSGYCQEHVRESCRRWLDKISSRAVDQYLSPLDDEYP